MIALLRQRNYGLLWTGGFISQTGDWLLTIGLPLAVYRKARKAAVPLGRADERACVGLSQDHCPLTKWMFAGILEEKSGEERRKPKRDPPTG